MVERLYLCNDCEFIYVFNSLHAYCDNYTFTIETYHASESIGGLAAGVFIIGMLAGRLGAGRIIDHLQPKNVLIGGVIGSIIAIALYFTIHSILILMFVRFIHGIAFGFFNSNGYDFF